jgi:hypothetical protein
MREAEEMIMPTSTYAPKGTLIPGTVSFGCACHLYELCKNKISIVLPDEYTPDDIEKAEAQIKDAGWKKIIIGDRLLAFCPECAEKLAHV